MKFTLILLFLIIRRLMNKNIISVFTLLYLLSISVKASPKDIQPDVTSYHLSIEPKLAEGTVRGSVIINLQVNCDMDTVISL